MPTITSVILIAVVTLTTTACKPMAAVESSLAVDETAISDWGIRHLFNVDRDSATYKDPQSTYKVFNQTEKKFFRTLIENPVYRTAYVDSFSENCSSDMHFDCKSFANASAKYLNANGVDAYQVGIAGEKSGHVINAVFPRGEENGFLYEPQSNQIVARIFRAGDKPPSVNSLNHAMVRKGLVKQYGDSIKNPRIDVVAEASAPMVGVFTSNGRFENTVNKLPQAVGYGRDLIPFYEREGAKTAFEEATGIDTKTWKRKATSKVPPLDAATIDAKTFYGTMAPSPLQKKEEAKKTSATTTVKEK